MNWQKLVQGIVTASLIIVFSEAVLSCTPIDGASSDDLHAAAVATLQAYHLPTIGLALGILALFLLRRCRGLLILLFAVAALAISPGWSPDANAVLLPNCRPKGELGVQIVLGVVAVCFIAQLIFWIVERRRSRTHENEIPSV